MKNLKLLVIGAAALIMGSILTGCASMIIVGIDEDSVSGPRQVRQYQSLDPKDITVYAFYKDESRKPVTIRSADITFDSTRVGRQTVNINVSGFTVSFETEVVALTGIRIVTPPTTTVFKVGTEPARASRSGGTNPLGGTVAMADPSSLPYAWTGIQVQGVWDQLGSAPIDIGDCTTTGYNRDRVGKQNITVTYNGKTATFEVEVIQLMSIRVASPPTKTTYIVGESIAPAGISVIGTYSNNSTEPVTSGLTYSGFDSSTAGTKTVTVTAGGRTATFNVTVISVTSIAITRQPTKTTYNAGEALDLTGIVVTATYSNGTSGQTTITNSNVTGFNSNNEGQQRLTVTVAGRTATFNVTVLPRPVIAPSTVTTVTITSTGIAGVTDSAKVEPFTVNVGLSTLPGFTGTNPLRKEAACGFTVVTASGKNLAISRIELESLFGEGNYVIYISIDPNYEISDTITVRYTPDGTHVFRNTNGVALPAFNLTAVMPWRK